MLPPERCAGGSHQATSSSTGSAGLCASRRATWTSSLADLVSPRNFREILTHRYESKNGAANSFDIYLARALIRIAREWVKLGSTELAELNRLAARLPKLTSGLTTKNRATLRQFDDPAALQRLYALPDQLWAEVKRDRRCNHYTLANAQAALAIGLLSYAPIRLQNLASLRFGGHLFVRQGPSAISLKSQPMKSKTGASLPLTCRGHSPGCCWITPPASRQGSLAAGLSGCS
jgi:hypothetical protein